MESDVGQHVESYARDSALAVLEEKSRLYAETEDSEWYGWDVAGGKVFAQVYDDGGAVHVYGLGADPKEVRAEFDDSSQVASDGGRDVSRTRDRDSLGSVKHRLEGQKNEEIPFSSL